MQSKLLAEPKFVGREKELETLEYHLKQAIEGKGTTVFVSGEAGVGKTRLINAFLKKAKTKGVTVLSGWCLSESGVPYFPFIEAFNTYFASYGEEEQPSGSKQPEAKSNLEGVHQIEGEKREITAWLTKPRLAEKPGKYEMLSPQVWKDQAFAAVAKTLHSISAREPIVFLIEDIHWADSASQALIHYIARVINNSERILVLGTYRSEELTADIEGHPHHLIDVLRLMRREDLFTEIKLFNLNNADVARIAEDMIGRSLQPQLAEKLAVESKGNPLFIVESLRMLHERQSLTLENNQWRLAVTELDLPNKIRDIILRRLAVLKYSQRRVLDAAAVIGEKFDVKLLSSVLEMDVLGVLETLNTVANNTSLVSVEENRYKFDHERSRKTLYEELALPLRQGYHARIADILESRVSLNVPLNDLFYHYAEAGNKEKALEYALAAAKDALARFSNQQAIQHFKYVLQNTLEDHADQRCIALEGLGDAYVAGSMFAEAIKTFNELATSSGGLVRLRALRKVMDAAFYKGDEPDLLLEKAKEAEKLANYSRLEMARVINNRGRAYAYAGRGEVSQDLADYNTALQIFEEENSLSDVAEALMRSALITTGFGNVDEGFSRILQAIAIFREIGDVRKEAETAYSAGTLFMGNCFFSKAEREYESFLKIGKKLGKLPELAYASLHLSMIYEHNGNLMGALAQTIKAKEYAEKTDAIVSAGLIDASFLRLYCKIGDIGQADRSFKNLMKSGYKTLMLLRGFGGEVMNVINPAKGVYFAARGQFMVANKIFENHFGLIKIHFADGYEVKNREDYAWVLEKQGKVEEAKIQRDKIQNLLEQANNRLEYSNIQLSVMTSRKIQVGEEFQMRFDLVNVGRNTALLGKIEGVIPSGLKVVDHTLFCSIQNGNVMMKEKSVGSFQVETIKLKLKATKEGNYAFNPKITYVDEMGQTKTSTAKALTVSASSKKPAFEVLPERMTTGYMQLDRLLMGGIPEKAAVVLTGSPSDERAFLIKSFLEAGIEDDENVFYITTEADNIDSLLENPNFHLFLCNPKPKTQVPDMPNVTKLKSKTDINNLNMALSRESRDLQQEGTPKRLCIEIASDVLLRLGPEVTRRWLSELTTDLGGKGFTTLAVMDPSMHPADQANAVINSFDGEISITQIEEPTQCRKFLRVRRLKNQDYLKNSACITM